MACGDVLSLEDLQTAKKHQIFEAEVITGKAGGVAGGAEIEVATNTVTGQTQETLPHIISNLGFKPGAGDFSTGFTVQPGQRDFAWYDPVSFNWYSYLGPIPSMGHVVTPGTNPVEAPEWKPTTDPDLRNDLAADNGASLVGFKQAGTGATPRTVQDELMETVSVAAFGAQGGGVFDDTTAFIAAGATNKPALVPFPIVKLTSDVAGQFYSYTPVKIVGTGYANISLLTLGDVRPSTDVTGEIEVFAHRGFAGQAPQNTMLAFSTAISRGADGLEMDLQFSSDGVLYVFHDTTVDVLTNGTGTFTTLTSAAIDGLTFDSTVGTPFADESIPRFEEVLKLARRAGVKISVEMKNVWSQAQMTILLNLLEQYGYNNRHCTVSAGYIVYCEDFRVLSPSVGISYIHAGSFAAAVPFIDRLKVISGELTIKYTDALAEPNIVTYAYSKGVDVSAWTITSAEQAKSLVDINIRKIVSDISFGGTV